MTSQYDVGYGKPPKKSRFQKGKSGNPKGRSKPAMDFQEKLISELKSTVTVLETGKKKTISKWDALIKAAIAHAIQGNVMMIKFLFELIGKLPPNAFEEEGVEVLTYRWGPRERALIDQVLADAKSYDRE